ncbi:hypothetical protein AAHA92_25056 [Salvia divinorum]|uniref:Uncharacterized protein n=1 Tax=Salvia divinorum TaxID=28513 RepID=A0ABD1GCI1_SALDI
MCRSSEPLRFFGESSTFGGCPTPSGRDKRSGRSNNVMEVGRERRVQQQVLAGGMIGWAVCSAGSVDEFCKLSSHVNWPSCHVGKPARTGQASCR